MCLGAVDTQLPFRTIGVLSQRLSLLGRDAVVRESFPVRHDIVCCY